MSEPPWSLDGFGYIWLYRFPRKFVLEQAELEAWQQQALLDTFGMMMWVRYERSNVGAYDEWLLVPGRFLLNDQRLFSISTIYVSTEASATWGRANWGIPKRNACFEHHQSAQGRACLRVSVGDQLALLACVQPWGIRFPLSSAMLPLSIGQRQGEDLLITQPYARGWARLCRVHEMVVARNHFPDVTQTRPLLVLAVTSFRMVFPPPLRVAGYFSATSRFASSLPRAGAA
ncbi:MAG: hypothetical protein NZL91_07415 [Thermoflexales bacterium]|nr:hypothetical protein [Thermoflexales bacterium]MCS7325393.1 hypothetical protein [Thermoflexales bacterium]MCX7938345.1 hypothetical protein [Thermoflexales bacterium]MDW8053015.1 hypothetical protein [Anaerolineae bacterium]MDW8291668.1 hypothetical protein [Anaerolineae bacterium]